MTITHLSAEVTAALAAGQPVVALESTIITHGMPYPQNLEMARRVEDELRGAGAVPATIAVIDGQFFAGLTPDQLEQLARTKGAAKLSRADLALAAVSGATGGTTVAATMIIARDAGISVFATGGIGGVHHDAADSFDISADLSELAETAVTVVAAGAKAILDLPKTLEVLETRGVPVITVGQDEFPAFWSRKSGLKSPSRMDDARSIAAAQLLHTHLGLPGGQLVANPIPVEAEIGAETMAPIIARATREASEQGISGKSVTPFLLQRILELTDGASLTANIALVLSNARLAAAIAREMCELANVAPAGLCAIAPAGSNA